MSALPSCMVGATCITCSSVFHAWDEDGAPEIPGQRCAIGGCPTWICDASCAEHFSLVCGCGQRVCQEHIVRRHGFDAMCAACATRLVSVCRECDELPVENRYADGLGTCAACHTKRRNETYAMPDCPDCGHRMWVRDLDERVYRSRHVEVLQRPGRMFSCDCGLNFTREAAAAARKEPQTETRRVLFAPALRTADRPDGRAASNHNQ